MQLGLEPGDKVAILSENRKERVFAELGIDLFRAITTGVYLTSPASEVEYLLSLSDAPIIICEDQEQLDKVLSVRRRLPRLRLIIVIDPRGLRHYDRAGLHNFEDVIELGRQREAKEPHLLAENLARQQLDDIGLIVFTSGSTGRPKAAMMSWRGDGSSLSASPADLMNRSCLTTTTVCAYMELLAGAAS